MAADTGAVDLPIVLEAFHMVNELRFKGVFIVFCGVHKMHHTDVHIIGMETTQEILKIFSGQFNIAVAGVLITNHNGTDMFLQDQLVSMTGNGLGDSAPEFWLRPKKIIDIDFFADGILDRAVDFLLCASKHVFAAKTNDRGVAAKSGYVAVLHKGNLRFCIQRLFEIVMAVSLSFYGASSKTANKVLLDEDARNKNGESCQCGSRGTGAPINGDGT